MNNMKGMASKTSSNMVFEGKRSAAAVVMS